MLVTVIKQLIYLEIKIDNFSILIERKEQERKDKEAKDRKDAEDASHGNIFIHICEDQN